MARMEMDYLVVFVLLDHQSDRALQRLDVVRVVAIDALDVREDLILYVIILWSHICEFDRDGECSKGLRMPE